MVLEIMILFEGWKTAAGSKSSPLSLKIQEYEIENFKFRYFDESSKIKMVIDSLNHKGTDFAAQKLDLPSRLQKFRSTWTKSIIWIMSH
jgi:hypothetical protein